jgi:hypothetical protein
MISPKLLRRDHSAPVAPGNGEGESDAVSDPGGTRQSLSPIALGISVLQRTLPVMDATGSFNGKSKK